MLDHLLVNAAVAAGAELREGFHVQELLMEGEQVTGIRGRHIQEKPVTEKATFVMGADGMRSVVARAVQAPTYQDRPVFCCTYYAYWSGISLEGVEIYPRDHRTVITFPTNDGKVLVAIQWPREEFDAFHDAELLAEAIDSGLAGRRPLQEALAD